MTDVVFETIPLEQLLHTYLILLQFYTDNIDFILSEPNITHLLACSSFSKTVNTSLTYYHPIKLKSY